MTSDANASLASLFELHAALNEAPQLAWGVVAEGELRWHGGHDADADTVFRIASMSKSFTAAAVLMLRDRGAFALDDPIVKYAAELESIRYPTTDSRPVTIRDLLTMSSGLCTDDPWADRRMDITDDELDAVIAAGVEFAVPTGTAMQYSNLGYGLLGRVVLRSTGRTVQDVVRHDLMAPLGMTSSGWTQQHLPSDATIAKGHARIAGGEGWRDEPFCGDGAIAPMGGVFTTVRDLARWVAFMLDAFPARDGDDGLPLCRASRREMQQGWRTFAPDERVAIDGVRRSVQGAYGMGLMMLHHDQLGTVVTHSGGIPGFGSNMRWVPGASIGVIALANVTYARMADATAAALELLTTRGDVVRPGAPVTPRLRAAAHDLVALISSWDDGAADALLADNMFSDHERSTLATRARTLMESHGTLTIERIEALNRCEADVHVRGQHISFTIEFSTAPHAQTRIQHYEIKA